MLKNYLLYLIVFILLICAALIMFHSHSGTLRQEIGDFIPPDITAVDQVDISRDGQHITLDKKSDSWELHSSGKTKNGVVDLFFAGLQRFEIVSPASKADRTEIGNYLVKEGKLVTFFHHNRKIRTFYIGYDTLDVKGTYIMSAKRKLPYRVKLKGYGEVNMENLFSLHTQTWLQNKDTVGDGNLQTPGGLQKKH